MKILILDSKTGRGTILAQAFAEPDRRTAKHSEYVNGVGGGVLDDWDDDAKESCLDYLKREHPDMLLLHVGDQKLWHECLTEIYQDYIVACFTGASIPQRVKDECAIIKGGNPKHCYYPGPVSEFLTADAYRKSDEGSALRKFIDGVEEYLKKTKDAPQEAKEILQKAKETLQQFNSGLETALNELTEDLGKLCHGRDPPSKDALEKLATKRDDRLRDVYQ